ncbi:MAG TPA: hypothetical protein VF683_10855, partial [Chthoniobacterales bacterium]
MPGGARGCTCREIRGGTGRRMGCESSSACHADRDLTTRPGPRGFDRPSRPIVARAVLLKQRQHMLSAFSGLEGERLALRLISLLQIHHPVWLHGSCASFTAAATDRATRLNPRRAVC